MQAFDLLKLERAARKLDHRAKLLRAWELKGGISAQMHALELQSGDGSTRKVIVRRPGEDSLHHNAHAAVHEYRILQFVQQTGVKAQMPYLLDTSGEIFAEPYLILEYIEGEPLYDAAGDAAAADCAAQMATQLARLHAIAITDAPLDLHFLPRQAERMARLLRNRPAVLDETLDERRVRAVLEAVWPLPPPPSESLLHGDFWPGNLLWQGGELMAVIDWEDAAVGDPLADFAIARLDVLWVFGADALAVFTGTYQQLTRRDLAPLPYWDLFAALRSASRLDEWAATWAELGRSDMSAAKMAADRRGFVEQAFKQLIQLRDIPNASNPAMMLPAPDATTHDLTRLPDLCRELAAAANPRMRRELSAAIQAIVQEARPISSMPDLSAQIQVWIDALNPVGLGDWPMRVCQEELNALPLHSTLIYLWAIRPDGTLLCMDHEAFGHPTEPERDALTQFAVMVNGAANYPALRQRIPMPPPDTRVCAACDTTGILNEVSCPACGGLGWVSAK